MDAKLLTSLFIAIMGTAMMIMMGAIGWCVKDIRSSMQRSQEKNELAIKDLRADFEQMRSDMRSSTSCGKIFCGRYLIWKTKWKRALMLYQKK